MDTVNINLCKIPFLDTSYKDVIDFEDIESRDDWFNNKVSRTMEVNLKYDCNRTTVTVDMTLQQANNYDYLFYDGVDRRYFYFITTVEYNTPKTTIYSLELDVFNTYYYDVELQNSFVDRMHVNRWNGDIPTYNVEDEGLSIGEYKILENPTELYRMKKALVIATSVPIGITEESQGSGSSSGYGGSWQEGKVSSSGFRFIKGYEGFAAYSYTDSEGIPTIGYGVAQHANPSLYNELYAESPITEERAARVMYDLLNSNYASKIVQTCIDIGITSQHQFDALASLAYNSGYGSITGDNSLMNAIAKNPTDEATIRPIWESFKTNGGLAGLVTRRKEECDMFFGLSVAPRPIVTITQSGGYGPAVTDNDGNGWLPQDDGYMNDDSNEGYNGHISVSNDFGSGWLVPVKGATVTSVYGWRNCPYHGREMHPGVDLGCPTGTPVLATKSGTVTRAGFDDSMGNHIYIDHGGIITKYMHLSSMSVAVGDIVNRCQEIGKVGSTGNSTGPHLHWEFRNVDNESCIPIPDKNTKGSTV